ncbi:MAG TPA: hypothetical protein VIR58_16110 [Acidimicrobiales bacterium]
MTAFSIDLDPARVGRLLTRVAVLLLVTSTTVAVTRVAAGGQLGLHDFGARFDVDSEGSIPTWFSSLVLLAGALLLAVTAADHKRAGGRDALHWSLLAALLCVFSLDEVASFHEYTSVVLDVELFGFESAFSWVVFGLAFTVVFAVVMTPFVRRLDLRLRRRLTLAAGLYFGGALGVEMLNADVAASAVDATYRYVLQTAAEEALEMAGAIALVYALLHHLRERSVSVSLDFGAPSAPRGDAP